MEPFPQQTRPSRRILGFDGVRGLAAMLVFIEHYWVHTYNLGAIGVDVFFVLSGFLIVGILHRQRTKIELGLSTKWAEFRSFWVKRIRRIFPVYYLALFIILAFQIHTYGRNALRANGLDYYFVMMGTYYLDIINPHWTWFSHLWSIGPEQHFYMLASPLLLLLFPSRAHMKVIVGLFLFSLTYFVLGSFPLPKGPWNYLASVQLFFFMAAGGFMVLHKYNEGRTSEIMDYALAVLGILSQCAVTYWRPFLLLTSPYLERACTTLACILFGCGIIRFVYRHQKSWVVKFLELAPLVYLGEISYGFYIYHYLILSFIHHLPGYHFLMKFPMTLLPITGLVLSLAVASLSWEFFEKKLLHRR